MRPGFFYPAMKSAAPCNPGAVHYIRHLPFHRANAWPPKAKLTISLEQEQQRK